MAIGVGVTVGSSVGSVIPGVGTGIGAAVGGLYDTFNSFFGTHKTLHPTKASDIVKQNKVANTWKRYLNSMGYPISLEQSKAILGTHWGGNFNEILAQYNNFVSQHPKHAKAQPYGSSWKQFVSKFPSYSVDNIFVESLSKNKNKSGTTGITTKAGFGKLIPILGLVGLSFLSKKL